TARRTGRMRKPILYPQPSTCDPLLSIRFRSRSAHDRWYIELLHHPVEGEDIGRLEVAQTGELPIYLRRDVAVDVALLLRRCTFGALHHIGEREKHVVQTYGIVQRDLIRVRVDLHERVADDLQLLAKRCGGAADARGVALTLR